MREHYKNSPQVSFDYKLTGTGWARADLRIGTTRVSLRVSYLTDGLGDIVRAAIAIGEGASDQTVIWVEEPGYNELAFSQRAGTVTIQIWHYPNLSPSHSGEMGELRMHQRFSPDEFFAAISSGTRDVLSLHGVEGYKEEWHAHEYPTGDAGHLAELIGATDE